MDRTNLIIQVVTSAAIVLGLALVVWELRQTKVLARVERGAEIAAHEVQKHIAQMGEQYPSVYVKGCLTPELLTDEEYAVEVAALSVDYNIALRLRFVESVGAFGMDWRTLAHPNLHNILSRPIGRARFSELGRRDAALEALAAEMLETGQITPCAEHIEVGRPRASAGL